MGEEKEEKEGICHQKHNGTLFSTHSVPLEKSQRDNFNHILKDHQTRM